MLAQAKNGDQVFWEEKFHAANGKAQACTQGALLFFLLCLEGRGWGIFSYFPASQCVRNMFPFKFPMGSQHVPQFRNVFPNMFSIPPQFYPICLGKWCPPFTYIGGPKGKNYIFQNRAFCFGNLHSFIFFSVMGLSNWHVAKKNKNKELGRHLI